MAKIFEFKNPENEMKLKNLDSAKKYLAAYSYAQYLLRSKEHEQYIQDLINQLKKDIKMFY